MERDVKRCQIHNRFNYLYAILEYMTCIVFDLWQMANKSIEINNFNYKLNTFFYNKHLIYIDIGA